ncbi:hypothetical protein [Trinickia fusca]|uniref:Uncharacterized protein n=1 Tax=Trinickia fusca TaxID=2419777 RepID=A0A494X482_9BURK|nr:hypothetical protein [Trinickia fusca]RKP45150.1 hypothetical protein D7S89_20145 [Trinickia fusca]
MGIAMGRFGERGDLKTYAGSGCADRYRAWRQAALCTALSTLAIVPYAQTAPNGGTEMSVVARAAQTVGIRQCFPVIDRVSSRVLADNQGQDIVADWDHINPDNAPFFSLTGFQYHGEPALFSLTTIPDNVGHCAILAERISVSPVSCTQVASKQLVGYRGTPLVKAITVYSLPSRPRETITLSNIAGGCLIVRRQVEYQWPAAPASPGSSK